MINVTSYEVSIYITRNKRARYNDYSPSREANFSQEPDVAKFVADHTDSVPHLAQF